MTLPGPFCSIIVSSYNKANYVGLAVESALAQTYRNTEVIVVDDGSVDDSIGVLANYRDRLTLIIKPNGGQASAMNRGFIASRGDIVFFLDCDDLLDCDTVERVVAKWTPALAKAHFRLRKITSDGSPAGDRVLPPYRPLPSGDMSGMLRRFGFYPAPPTTGNAFARNVLNEFMPIPEAEFKAWPDTFLIGISALFGDVIALEGTGGCWRESASNYSNGGLDKVQSRLAGELRYIEVCREVGKGSLPATFAPRWPLHLKGRLILQKFGTPGVMSTGQLASVAGAYLWAILRWPEYSWRERVRFGAWGVAMLVLPKAVLRLIPGVTGPTTVLG